MTNPLTLALGEDALSDLQAELVDATPWGHIDVALLQSGVYARILDEAGIAYPPIDWAQVAETEAAIMRGTR